ncbi:MAG: 3-phosphoshikimate 1-carboxyvinyltransferase [Cyclobacteriaceae bacterium]|nr:3-phosphoshikimate 1-carboxyvinyltransferase [Cyclobacteriaceae bacterium]UYN86376.1 MAG: 3-phosphoshikimate 1-carboxyvinyltransferase [Cyclobacteriaceae bacterium]
MNSFIHIKKNERLSGIVASLPASKSISNRVLILDALAGGQSELLNLSEANDTVLMRRLIHSTDPVLDVEDAGTTMRFLTAYLAVSKQRKILTGTARMKLRPIGILVDALRKLGGQVEYLEKEGFPPIEILGFESQQTNQLNIRGDVSSQYISALMMIGPSLPKGLRLILEGKIGSKPYIEMTASLMRRFGIEVASQDAHIEIPHQVYKPVKYSVEADWSAASYWFAFTALATDAEIALPNIALRSLQGDRVIVDMMEQLGVKAEPRGNTLLLTKKDTLPEFSWDFTHCPDLAQTVAVVCAAKGIKGTFTGLESLRIKETDRISALHHELQKIGAQLIETGSDWKLVPSQKLPDKITAINTYLDHRMAMAFAPLACLADIALENPGVVKKSYPGFWNDLQSVGFKLSATEGY